MAIVLARGLPDRPRHCARRCLGWTAVAARAECAAGNARLVRDDGAARRAGRASCMASATLPAAVRDPVAGRFPFVGLALSLLLRLRDQRGRLVRAPAAGRHARIRATSHRAELEPNTGRRIAAFRRAYNVILGAFGALRELCAVPRGDRVSVVVDRAVLEASRSPSFSCMQIVAAIFGIGGVIASGVIADRMGRTQDGRLVCRADRRLQRLRHRRC